MTQRVKDKPNDLPDPWNLRKKPDAVMCISDLSTPGEGKLKTVDLLTIAHESLIPQAHREQKFLERVSPYVFTHIRLINSLEPQHWGDVGMLGV